MTRIRNAACSNMTPKRKRRGTKSRAQAAAEHRELLEQLELVDSCCDICHCDCYSSHSSSNASGRSAPGDELQQLEKEIHILEQLKRSESAQQRRPHSSGSRQRKHHRSASRSPTVAKAATKRTASTPTPTPQTHSRRGSAECCQSRVSTAGRSRRSKSAGSQRSQSRQEKQLEVSQPQQQPQSNTETIKKPRGRRTGAQRDCQMLQVRWKIKKKIEKNTK